MDTLIIARLAMEADLRRAESISQNVANITTPGYKRQVAVTHPFEVQMTAAMAQSRTSSTTSLQARPAAVIDAAPGTAQYTGNVHDHMIEGTSFFEIVAPDGLAYTRQGNLRADASGRLVTGAGWPVLGQGGSEIVLGAGAFSITASGEVRQEGRVVGKLKLVRFTDPPALEPHGAGRYRIGRAQLDTGPNPDTLRSGFIEGSNVSSSQEMVRLTETVRHFEALHKVVQGYDESMEKAIRKLGEF